MKAAMWVAPNKLEMQDLPIPKAAAGEAVIKVLGCGVCGTDVHIYCGEVPLAKPPNVLGHEVYGEVIEAGEGVTSLKPGDRVSVDPVVGCGVCPQCQEGMTNLCPRPTIIGYARCGGFAQYTSVPATHLYRVSEKMSAKEGIIAETLACVINGFDRLNLKGCCSALILGAGSVGLLWTELLKHSLTTRVIQTEVVPERGAIAKTLGADAVIDAGKPDWQKDVLAIEPSGVDYIIDASGTARAIQDGFGLLKRGGTFMVFGVCPEHERVTISPYEMFSKEISFIGAKMPPRTLGRAVKILEAKKVNCEAIVTTVMPLSRLAEAIELFQKARNKHVKIMIDPWMD